MLKHTEKVSDRPKDEVNNKFIDFIVFLARREAKKEIWVELGSNEVIHV